MRIRIKRPWWLPVGKRAISLPPFRTYIDPDTANSGQYGDVLQHEGVHWGQFYRDGWSFYPRYVWQWVQARGNFKLMPYEQEARKISGVW